ncbi:MAG: EscU/YscU/HrcU family type III secretion system export apparatus switch protein [Pseudomonadota bacterium]
MIKKRKKAVALRYDPNEDRAPKITAKGEGLIAERIIELARQYDIPVKDDPDLIEVLSNLDIKQEIPTDIYIAVAELLAFVYSLNKRRGK